MCVQIMSTSGLDGYWTNSTSDDKNTKEAKPAGTSKDASSGNYGGKSETEMQMNALYRENGGAASQIQQSTERPKSLVPPASNSNVKKIPVSISKGKQTRFSGETVNQIPSAPDPSRDYHIARLLEIESLVRAGEVMNHNCS